MSQWYERSFGTDYLVVYKHRDWKNAYREVVNMARWLQVTQGTKMLDVGCGMGRHALSLAGLGCKVTGIDLSEELLQKAQDHDTEGEVAWKRADMRELPFENGEFEVAVNLFTSFGYFDLDADNLQALQEMHRVLQPEGRFLIDFLNPEYVRSTLVPESFRVDTETGWGISESRIIDNNIVKKNISIIPQDKPHRHYSEQVKLYDLSWFQAAFREVGFEMTALYGDYDGSEYSTHSKRMIMCGKRR
ncbi:class I SAM-dependent methyltransferase [Paenibacillus sp. NPDC057934]|uniref:class I SAM-dependent methyltransferase n=1 Tax=Paenibacillus sp. NPDC057934 TaxID=3346282 RepID=UPI0036D8AE44